MSPGINNNLFQIERAKKYTKKAGLENQITFQQADFMKLKDQFGEGSFDAGEFRRLDCLTQALSLLTRKKREKGPTA